MKVRYDDGDDEEDLRRSRRRRRISLLPLQSKIPLLQQHPSLTITSPP